jgi:hypothetical protein
MSKKTAIFLDTSIRASRSRAMQLVMPGLSSLYPTVCIRDARLTSNLPSSFIQLPSIRLIPPTRLAHRLVSRRHQHNRQERHNQRAGAGDAPSAENDAQVRRVPCEEHLQLRLAWDCTEIWNGDAYVHVALGHVVVHAGHVSHVAVVHVGVIHCVACMCVYVVAERDACWRRGSSVYLTLVDDATRNGVTRRGCDARAGGVWELFPRGSRLHVLMMSLRLMMRISPR